MAIRSLILEGDGDDRHGTRNGYVNLGCRCDPCRDANARWHLARRAERAVSLSPNDPRHGRHTTYSNHGCRCGRCRAASTQRQREYRAGLKAGAS